VCLFVNLFHLFLLNDSHFHVLFPLNVLCYYFSLSPLSLSSSLPPSLSFCHSLSLCLSLFLSLSLCHSLSVILSLSFSLSFSLCHSLSLSVTLSLSLSLYHSLFLSKCNISIIHVILQTSRHPNWKKNCFLPKF
jgi:hypothetical protein